MNRHAAINQAVTKWRAICWNTRSQLVVLAVTRTAFSKAVVLCVLSSLPDPIYEWTFTWCAILSTMSLSIWHTPMNCQVATLLTNRAHSGKVTVTNAKYWWINWPVTKIMALFSVGIGVLIDSILHYILSCISVKKVLGYLLICNLFYVVISQKFFLF